MEEPGIQAIPERLDRIVDYLYPDALMVGATPHDDETWTLYILDLDYSYDQWLATISLAGTWTLSPVSGPCYDVISTPNDGGEPLAWRQRQNKRP